MFVGQAPGKNEDLQNECFVGESGKLLISLIEKHHIDDYEYRLENAVRCYPPNDKRPLKKQIEACSSYLFTAIKKYQPEIIVPLGSVALKALTNIDKLSDYLGTLFECELISGDAWSVFPMYHPSAILRNERLLGTFESQFDMLHRFIDNVDRIRKKYEIVTEPFLVGLDCGGAYTDSFDTPVAVDFETCGGFDPRLKNTKIRCLGYSDKAGRAKAFKIEGNKDLYKDISNFLMSRPIIAQNAKYEMKWCIEKLGIEPNIVDDTAIMAHLLNEEMPCNLEVIGTMYTQMQSHKGTFSYYMNKNGYDWGTVPFDELAKYNCADTDMTLRARNTLRKKIDKLGLKTLYEEVELPTMRTLARIELRGMHINVKEAQKVVESGKERMKSISNSITKSRKVKEGLNGTELNLDSSVQVNNLFYKWWNLDTFGIKKTSSGESFSTDKTAMELLSNKYPKVNLVREYRGISHGISDIKVILDKLVNDFISCDYTNTYVVTGRLSSKDPNLQNLPNPKEIREGERSRVFGDSVKKIFDSRFGARGGIMNADYSQLELRLCANESGDETYIDALNNNKDLHMITAESMYPDLYEVGEKKRKEYRFNAKRVNFGVQYNIGAGELSKQLRKPRGECQDYLDAYANRYTGVMNYMQGLFDYCIEHEYVVSKFGRIRHLPDVNSSDFWTAKRALNQACNFPIASLGADLTKWAMATLDQRLIDEGMKSMVIGQVHDSLIIDYYDRELRKLAKIVKEVSVDLAMKKWEFFEKVPLKMDISIGENWLEQEDL